MPIHQDNVHKKIAVNVNIESIDEFKVYTHMNQTLNALIACSLSLLFVFIPFSTVIRGESNFKTNESNSSRELMDKKNIDDLLGPDPYLFDPGNHMDGFDPTQRQGSNN